MFKRNLLALILSMVVILPVLAQEDAPEATPQPDQIVVGTGDVPVTAEEGSTVVVTNEAPPTDVVPVNFVYVGLLIGGAILLVALTLFAYLQGKTAEMLYKSTPPIVQMGGRLALELGIREALKTPDKLDEKLLEELAMALGYNVTYAVDGSVILEPKPAIKSPTANI